MKEPASSVEGTDVVFLDGREGEIRIPDAGPGPMGVPARKGSAQVHMDDLSYQSMSCIDTLLVTFAAR